MLLDMWVAVIVPAEGTIHNCNLLLPQEFSLSFPTACFRLYKSIQADGIGHNYNTYPIAILATRVTLGRNTCPNSI